MTNDKSKIVQEGIADILKYIQIERIQQLRQTY